MNLVEKDFRLFNREVVLFVKLKQQFDYDEIEWVKQQYKELWQKWKSLNLKAYEKSIRYIPYNKPKIESWTNGWQIRKHYWASYRMEEKITLEKYNKSVIEILEIETIVMKMLRDTFVERIPYIILENGQ